MKRIRTLKKKKLSAPSESQTHFRRCHICNEVTECDGTSVTTCSCCGKTMAPFYFFQDGETVPYSDVELRPAPEASCERMPVRGLTAIW